jgi:hypothetical protein
VAKLLVKKDWSRTTNELLNSEFVMSRDNELPSCVALESTNLQGRCQRRRRSRCKLTLIRRERPLI